MLVMLAFSIPLYVCATASTPIAAALILKGISPGAALVFLLAGPATNVASLTVLAGLLGKRAAFLYLGAIAVFSVLFGLLVDSLYPLLGLSPRAVMGQAGELIPGWAPGDRRRPVVGPVPQAPGRQDHSSQAVAGTGSD